MTWRAMNKVKNQNSIWVRGKFILVNSSYYQRTKEVRGEEKVGMGGM